MLSMIAARRVAGIAATRGFRSSAARFELTKFAMPAMSPTMTEGGIANWKFKEGDKFASGDVLLEIETDKATIDVEAQDDGVLAKIVFQDGSKGIPVGKTIAITGEEGDDLSGAEALASEPSGPSEAEAEPKAEEKKPEPAEPKKEESSSSATPSLGTPSDETKYGSGSNPKDTPKSPKEHQEEKPTIFASPLAKKLAIEKGIPLAQVKGTGPEGRIVKADIDNYKPSGASASAPKTAAPVAAPAEYEDIPVSNMRRVIGQRLTASKQELPHYYLTMDINMDRVFKLREVFNKAADSKTKLSVNDFIVKASSLALADVPEANSAWLGETIRQYKKADICVAVATPTGLITPIVKDAGAKGLATISTETKALAIKARDGKLKPEEYQGGSFTISNLGMYGISEFTAIINPPQSCILAVGATEDRVVPAPEDPKGFKVSKVMKVTLSSDHRTVDGAVGSRWLQAFKGYLEQPLTFML